MYRPLSLIALTASVGLTLTACSNGSDDSGIVSLADPTAAPSDGTATGTPEEQALAFAQCMRDAGIDFPDPTVAADGTPSFENAFQSGAAGGFDPGDSTFRDAITACSPLMDGAIFGGGPGGPGGAFDPAAIEDALVAYTQCLRDEGLDVGDITFAQPNPGDGANPQPSAAAGDGPQQGVRGPGGDPTNRFAEQLGQDATDPAWIAANATCQPALESALAGTRSGAQTGGTA